MDFRMFKKLEEQLNMLSRNLEDIKKDTKFLEMKIIMSEMKNTLDQINGRSAITDIKLSELEDIGIEPI